MALFAKSGPGNQLMTSYDRKLQGARRTATQLCCSICSISDLLHLQLLGAANHHSCDFKHCKADARKKVWILNRPVCVYGANSSFPTLMTGLGKHENGRKVELAEPELSSSKSFGQEEEDVSSKKNACTHPGSYGHMCFKCGESLDDETGVSFGYISKGLRLGNEEIVRLRDEAMDTLLHRKKLFLVLDLDHTVLNSTELVRLTPEEDYLKSQLDSFEDVSKGSLFIPEGMQLMAKLRPYVRTFLKEASEMFEMYIYTMGDRPYALEMAKLLDPKGEYFLNKVISRDDGTQRHQKALDVVLGKETAVVILDDTEHTWGKQRDNLIQMERYHFFASSCQQFSHDCKSLSELKNDELEAEGALATALQTLRRVHHLFFEESDEDLVNRDVRQVLKRVRAEVLEGCEIVFSRVFPTSFPARNHHLWKMAEQLGARCTTGVDESVTHVVSTDAGTEKSRWAVKEKKFLVHPRWLEAANLLWKKQPEDNFPLMRSYATSRVE